MGWRDTDQELYEDVDVATHHTRAIVWGALAVVLLAVAGALFSLLQ